LSSLATLSHTAIPLHFYITRPRIRKQSLTSTERNGRKTLTTVQGLPKKFDQKKILKVIKKKFACNGTIVTDAEMGEVVQLQGDQRKDVQDFLTDKKEGLGLEAKTIKVSFGTCSARVKHR
jgi:translation initiation factor SUI1